MLQAKRLLPSLSQSRGLFMGFRLLNKDPPKWKPFIEQRYPEKIYYQSLIKLQKNTRHLVPGSKLFNAERNKITAQLKEWQAEQLKNMHLQRQEQAKNAKWKLKSEDDFYTRFVKREFDTVKFHLIVVPHQLDCFEIENLLKFAQIPYLLEEDYGRKNIKQTLELAEEDSYPILIVESDIEEIKPVEIAGAERILNHLVYSNLIPEIRRHSAKETQGIEFIQTKVAPLLERLFWKWRHSLGYALNTNVFMDLRNKYLYQTIFQKLQWRLYILFRTSLRTFGRKRRDQMFMKRYEILDAVISEWVERVGRDHYFHGEEGPDRADFQMFAYLEKKIGYKWIRKVIEKNKDAELFYSWFNRMKTLIHAQPFSMI